MKETNKMNRIEIKKNKINPINFTVRVRASRPRPNSSPRHRSVLGWISPARVGVSVPFIGVWVLFKLIMKQLV